MRTDGRTPRRVLVVGGAGFVGAHLTRRLIGEGHSVAVLLRPSTNADRLVGLSDRLTLDRLNMADRTALQDCFDRVRPDIVFYLAGRTANRHMPPLDDARLVAEETSALLSVIEAAAEVRPELFVRTGTIAEYGAAPTPFHEDQRECPANGYALAAVWGTHLAQVLAPDLPFPLVTARLSLVYGPGQVSDFLVPSVVEACLTGRPLTLQRPHDRRDVLHVDDVVDALLALTRARLPGGTIVNIGSGELVSVADIASTVLALTGGEPALLEARPQDDPVTLLLATERMAQLTGWHRRVPLHDGLAALVTETRNRIGVRATTHRKAAP